MGDAFLSSQQGLLFLSKTVKITGEYTVSYHFTTEFVRERSNTPICVSETMIRALNF